MPPLNKYQRNLLEAAVVRARGLAEDGAGAVLGYLGVAEASPPSYLDEGRRSLRDRLRVHGRQLGDSENDNGTQTLDILVEEIAYEHWHRMLFAKYLAENNLLMYTGQGGAVPVTLEECAELAPGEGAADGWELAARCAARMLPQIFRSGSPVFAVVFPPEYRQGLEKEIAALPPEIYTARDSRGWLYQFWQTRRKADVNTSEVKIGARELPAVTQLFTEPYMVAFLLDNSLGAWWASRRLTDSDLAAAGCEAELRARAALPGVPLDYLRFVRDGDGPWAPAAGTFEGWPANLADFRLLDPCCGSGHFLTAAFRMLVPMRMEAEGLSAREAVDAVLRDNVHGLELDRRCVELAAFALAMDAWTYPGAGGYRELPELNVACSGTAVGAGKENWTALAAGAPKLENTLAGLYDAFELAPVLGSLIDTEASAGVRGLYKAEWADVKPLLDKALSAETSSERTETAVAAKGIAESATLLARRYTLVITNVPYLSRQKQDVTLMKFCSDHYPEAKNDLATVFLERCMKLCDPGCSSGVVLLQNWLFQKSYKKFREKLLKDTAWHLLVRLGAGAFEAIGGEVVKVALLLVSENVFDMRFITGLNILRGFDAPDDRSAVRKTVSLTDSVLKSANQSKQLDNPDAVVSLTTIDNDSLLGIYAESHQGIATADNSRYVMKFWERLSSDDGWEYYAMSPNTTEPYSGLHSLILWKGGQGELAKSKAARICGNPAWGKRGAAVAAGSSLRTSVYQGGLFDCGVAAVIPKDPSDLGALLACVRDQSFRESVKMLDKSVLITESSLLKATFHRKIWIEKVYTDLPHGVPAPYSDDPTQWIFHGHPCGSVIWDDVTKRVAHGPLRTDANVLQIAVARLLGYRWPSEIDAGMELSDEQRGWVRRCDDLARFVDADGIVAVPAVKGETAAVDRILDILTASYGKEWSNKIVSRLLSNSDHAGGTLESWLRDKFFSQHCKLFQNRPFIWQIWDGLRDGFSVLVNCHKLDRKLLESLTYTYLGDWIVRQKHALKGGFTGAVGAQKR
ncbi:MAG: SAM-dependent DNA methyltransferase, partial [Deltaproteobacteria bacterium]|nr:SAM-dependent DNA methyltransferase [Deltaproteobacteria bacterium]